MTQPSLLADAERRGNLAADAIMIPLIAEGWIRIDGMSMVRQLGAEAGDLATFAQAWHDLPLDRYMADGGTYRRRRFGVFRVAGGEVVRLAHAPHFQSRQFNSLNGGTDRWFAPMKAALADGPLLKSILENGAGIFSGMPGAATVWRVEVHQFRITADGEGHGYPTPEGRHRDGVFGGLVTMIAKRNIEGGCTRLWTPGGQELAALSLDAPMETVFFDDARILHEVTAISRRRPDRPGFRDVLVATFRAEAA